MNRWEWVWNRNYLTYICHRQTDSAHCAPPQNVLTYKSMGIIHVNKNEHNCLCNRLGRTFTDSQDWTDAWVSSTTYTLQPSLLLLIFLAEFNILYWEHFFCENKKCLLNLDRDVSSELTAFCGKLPQKLGSISRRF